MITLPACPQCQSAYTYEDGAMLVCPECAHEWPVGAEVAGELGEAGLVVKDANGALLAPSAALVRDGTAWRVFVVEGGRAQARAVTLKDRNADQAWIDGGVKAGESVVLYPGSMVADGQAVKLGR